MQWAQKQKGFTIVELLIVVVVIAILATITVVAYNGIRQRTETAAQESDLVTYQKAILAARNNTGLVLRYITGSTYSLNPCVSAGSNPSALEPRELPTSHACWTTYYANLTAIGNAANMNLDGLRKGDFRGNPYGLDENEGETCGNDQIFTFNGSGISRTIRVNVPRVAVC
jgi:prepilin-type N-terminal cleavage/methylation domain-containing protein